jgi:hypothetical protein
LACYDWRNNETYLIGEGRIGIVGTKIGTPIYLGAGVGLLAASRPNGMAIEGTYLCGGLGGAVGFIGGKGLLCGDKDLGLAKKLLFVGWQGGYGLQAGASVLGVMKF